MNPNVDVIIKTITGNRSDFFTINDNISFVKVQSYVKKSCVKYDENLNKLIIGGNDNYDELDIVEYDDLRRGIFIVPTSSMSKIESILTYKVKVQSQYDFTNVTNQCTWFSFLVAQKRHILLNMYNENKTQFAEKYNQILDDATIMRKTNYKFPQGENIDEIDTNLFQNIKLNMKSCLIGNTELLNILPKNVIDIIAKPHIPTYDAIELYSNLKNLNHGDAIIINRHGETFVCIANKNKFLLCDSHTHLSGTTTYSQLVKYIGNDNDAYNFILWTTCN
jgi:hypothetical protein